MKTLVIQLDRLEDTGSIRDKVTWGKSTRVLLAWPVNYSVFNRKVDLVAIKRICTSQGSRLGIVCDDPDVIAEAGELQIPVFNSVNQAMRKGWDRRWHQKSKGIDFLHMDPEGGIEEIRKRSGLFQESHNLPYYLRLALLMAGVAAVFITLVVILPSATIRIFPLGQSTEMNVQFLVRGTETATTGPDTLSGRWVEVTLEANAERQTTGSIPVADGKASGSVSITNLTNNEIFIPSGTIILNSSIPPVRYLILKDTELEPKTVTNEIFVEAVYGGESGNAEAGSINRIEGELGFQLELTNAEPITGGTDRKIPAPSQEDLIALKDDVRSLLIIEAEKKLSAELSDEEVLLPATIEAINLVQETLQPEVGQAGSSVHISRKVEFSALVINRKDLIQKAEAIISANMVLPGWKISDNEPIDVKITSQEYDNLSNMAKVNTLIKCKTVPIIRMDEIRPGMAGKRMDEAAELIAARIIVERATEFETWPIRLPVLPLLESRIKVAIP